MFEVLIFAAVAVLIGLALTFVGHPFFRILLPIWAFLAGMVLGIQGMDSLMGTGFVSTSLGLVVGFVLGAFLAAVSYFVYSFAIILFGAAVGYVLGQGLMLFIGFDYGFLTVVAGITLSIVFAALFAWGQMPKFLIILLTSLGGAMAVLTGIFVLFGKLPADTISLSLSRVLVQGSFWWFIIWLVLAGFGFAVQYAMTSATETLTDPYDYEKDTLGKKDKATK